MSVLRFFKKNKYYIKLYVNRIEIKNLVSGKRITEISNTEFNNQRLLIADFQKAEEFLFEVFKKNKFSTNFSTAIIQQKEMSEGGLSAVEKRVIIELFERIGFREIYIDESSFDLKEKDMSKY